MYGLGKYKRGGRCRAPSSSLASPPGYSAWFLFAQPADPRNAMRCARLFVPIAPREDRARLASALWPCSPLALRVNPFCCVTEPSLGSIHFGRRLPHRPITCYPNLRFLRSLITENLLHSVSSVTSYQIHTSPTKLLEYPCESTCLVGPRSAPLPSR